METIEQQCARLTDQLNIGLDIHVVSTLESLEKIPHLVDDTDALIVSNEDYAKNSNKGAAVELGIFEAIAQTGIPIIEVHERNILSEVNSRPYLDSPEIGAGLVSGMGPAGYSAAIRALARKLKGNAA